MNSERHQIIADVLKHEAIRHHDIARNTHGHRSDEYERKGDILAKESWHHNEVAAAYRKAGR